MTDREKFEAWINEWWPQTKGNLYFNNGSYTNNFVNYAWEGWQAALASQQPAGDGWITESQAERLAWLVECIRSAEVSLFIAEESSKGYEEETQQVDMAEGELYQFIDSLTRKDDSTPQCESSDEHNGWIEWAGGVQPVADDVTVEVWVKDHCIYGPHSSSAFRWQHGAHGEGNEGYDIIAYRVVKP